MKQTVYRSILFLSIIFCGFIFHGNTGADEGTRKWVFETGGSVVSSPTVGSDGTIYVGSNDGNLYAIDPVGNLKWIFLTKGAVHSRPAIGPDGTVYVGSWDRNLYAIKGNSRRVPSRFLKPRKSRTDSKGTPKEVKKVGFEMTPVRLLIGCFLRQRKPNRKGAAT